MKCVMDNYQLFNLTYISAKPYYKLSGNPLICFIQKIKRRTHLIIRDIFILYQFLHADLVYFPAMFVHFRILKAAIFFKKKILAEYYISMFDTLALDRKTYSEHSVTAQRYKEFDTLLQKHSRAIYLNLTEARRYAALCQLNLDDLDYTIIPLCVKERTKALLYYYSHKDTPFNIVWWGTYIPLHGLEKIILAIKAVVKKDENCHLYIFGNNDEAAEPYGRIIAENGLTNHITIRNDVTFYNGKLEKFLTEHCALSMGVFGDSEKARSVIVNKAVEAAGMKIPILTQHSEAFSEFFQDGRSIFMCEPSIEVIADNILSIKSMTVAEVEHIVNNSFKVFQDNFSTAAAYAAYENLLKEYVQMPSNYIK